MISVRSVSLLLLATGCSAPRCDPPVRTGELPEELRESSGVDFSLRLDGLLWSHNDSNADAVLFAIDSAGAIHGRVRVRGATNVDWEDLAVAPCGSGPDVCVWIGDIGDNEARRDHVVIYRLAEPSVGEGVSAPAEAFPARYPDGARDAETLVLGPGARPHIVTKGRKGGIELFRYPEPLRPGATATLERVHVFTDTAVALPEQVTGGDWSADGRWLALRTYATLYLWRMEEGLPTTALVPGGVPLDSLREYQGEGVALRDDGAVVLTSEAVVGEAATVGMLRCRLRR